jgi:hypothetical protein
MDKERYVMLIIKERSINFRQGRGDFKGRKIIKDIYNW